MLKIRSEVKVGIFALVTMGALYWGINFLKGQDLLKRNSQYYAKYDQVNGLQKSAGIFIKGYKVGVISDIIFDPVKSDQIVIEFNIRNKFPIPENSKARVFSDGLLGGKAIELVLGDSPRMLNSGDTLRSETDKDLFELAGSELGVLSKKAEGMLDDISTLMGTLNELLEQNSIHVNATMANLSRISGSLGNVFTGGEKDLMEIVSNLNTLSATLSQNSDRIEVIVGNFEGLSDNLNTTLPEVMSDLGDSMSTLNELLAKTNGTEGTVGKLVNDPQLYDSLVEAVDNLSVLLEDLNARPGRYVQFSVFGKKNRD